MHLYKIMNDKVMLGVHKGPSLTTEEPRIEAENSAAEEPLLLFE